MTLKYIRNNRCYLYDVLLKQEEAKQLIFSFASVTMSTRRGPKILNVETIVFENVLYYCLLP